LTGQLFRYKISCDVYFKEKRRFLVSDKEKNLRKFDETDDENNDNERVVIMTDEDGNEYYYNEELIIPVGKKRFAILASMEDGDDEDCPCGEDEDEMDVFIARIEIDENGEEVYVDPTDEEFEEVRAAYDKIMEEEE
jgi:uncharacterized protein YrzB (UPF0473 family)